MRSLADLNSLSANAALATDARDVLTSQMPIEREIETQADTWFAAIVLACERHCRTNPASNARGPVQPVKRGKTPVLAVKAARRPAHRPKITPALKFGFGGLGILRC